MAAARLTILTLGLSLSWLDLSRRCLPGVGEHRRVAVAGRYRWVMLLSHGRRRGRRQKKVEHQGRGYEKAARQVKLYGNNPAPEIRGRAGGEGPGLKIRCYLTSIQRQGAQSFGATAGGAGRTFLAACSSGSSLSSGRHQTFQASKNVDNSG